jgi:hypothetical protein
VRLLAVVVFHQHALACLRQEMRSRLPRPVPINAVWAMDLTFYADTTGRQQMALGILDHGSRLVTCLSTLLNKRSWTLLGHLCLAIGRYGKPGRIRTDNEIIFTSFVFVFLFFSIYFDLFGLLRLILLFFNGYLLGT